MKAWVVIEFLLVTILLCLNSVVLSDTDPGDYVILEEFRKGLDNADLLKWPSGNQDPCGPLKWKYVFCKGSRVAQIQVQGMQLSGLLPQSFNKLTELSNIGLQKNNFNGKLSSFNGLSKLQYAYLGNNRFDTIPSYFFVGLTSLQVLYIDQVLSIDKSPLNQSTGWQIPLELEKSGQLMNLSLMGCSLIGPIPDFLGRMSTLANLKLSYNKLTGGIPASLYGSSLQTLWLNNQLGAPTLTSIDVIASMPMLTNAWLHRNAFTGSIPSGIGACVSLKTLFLNGNKFVGLIPENLTTLPHLESLKLENNIFMGPIPKLKFNFTYVSNSLCQATPGASCSPEVSALLYFLSSVNYPSTLALEWSGNDPCGSSWVGIACSKGNVSIINLPGWNLNGTIIPSVANLDSLLTIRIDRNNLTGPIPDSFTSLKSLKVLNLSDNNIAPPLPKFGSGVTLLTLGNPLLDSPVNPISPAGNAPPSEDTSHSEPSSCSNTSPNPHNVGSNSGNSGGNLSNGTVKSKVLIVAIPIVVGVFIILLVILCVIFRRKHKKDIVISPCLVVVSPEDSSDSDRSFKNVIANKTQN